MYPNQSATTPLMMMKGYGQTSVTIFQSQLVIQTISIFIHSTDSHHDLEKVSVLLYSSDNIQILLVSFKKKLSIFVLEF